jgi:NAD(P)-dependent dehydrogenase (short-subunit alcohol dehydrogenase family)
VKIDSSISAVVTGGASGLGLGTVKALRELGVKVAIFDLNADAGEALAAELGATFCKVDVTSDEQVDAGLAKARAANGQERILINCAGGARSDRVVIRDKETGELSHADIEKFRWTIELSLIGTYRCIVKSALGMAKLEPLEDGERGAIVNTGSIAAEDGQVGQASYSASKAGVKGMTLTLARDMARHGIRINTILPGIMSTPPMLRVRPQVLDTLFKSVPFPKRLGKPEEYADLAITMCRNGYFNGETVRLDGAIRMPFSA